MSKWIKPETYRRFQREIKIIGVLSILATIAVVIYLIRGLNIFENPDALSQKLQGHLVIGGLIFMLVQIIQVVIPIIPGGVTTVIGFMAFGPVWGFVFNYIGICVGSIILFWLVREYGRPFILLFVDEKHLVKYEQKMASPTYETFFTLNMLSPVSPADVLVMVTGLSKMSYGKFIRIILLCKPLSIFAYSYFWIYGGQWLSDLF